MWKIRVVLIGDTGTGKSMLLQRCTRGAITDHVYPTIGIDYSSVDVSVDGVDFKIQLWDTGGHERFRSIVGAYYRGAAAILLCVAADSMRTLQNARTYWHAQILAHNPGAHVVVVLTKMGAAQPDVVRATEKWSGALGLVLHKTDAQHSDCLHVLRDVASLCYSSPPAEGVTPAATPPLETSVQPLLGAGRSSSGCCCGRI